MTPKQFYKKYSKERLEEVVNAAGTNKANFYQIALFGGSVSSRLASALAEASNQEMTEMEILYPDRFDKPEDIAS